jgi:hypothetical protein
MGQNCPQVVVPQAYIQMDRRSALESEWLHLAWQLVYSKFVEEGYQGDFNKIDGDEATDIKAK